MGIGEGTYDFTNHDRKNETRRNSEPYKRNGGVVRGVIYWFPTVDLLVL